MTAIIRHPAADHSAPIYRFGLCAEAAIALSRSLGLDIGILGIQEPDPTGEHGDTVFVSKHAVVILDADNEIWMDAYGIFVGFDELATPGASCAWEMMFPFTEEGAIGEFSMEPLNEKLVDGAFEFLRANDWLGQLRVTATRYTPVRAAPC